MGDIGAFIREVAILAPPILLALSVHEACHALVASWRGDPTARLLGRVTLNPMKHLDPMGTMVFFISALAGAGFGWAKPVPVNPNNLKDPRWDGVLVSAAGPVSNLVTAVALAIVLNLTLSLGTFTRDSWWLPLLKMMVVGVQVNVVFAIFNLIPIPPLDGSGVLAGFLSPSARETYWRTMRYGFLVLLGLIILPDMMPGFPDIIHLVVVTPASAIINLLLG
jgi:Zn-dependent protease